MNIAILSRSSKLYSTRRLKEAAESRGHQVQVVNPLKCYMNISSKSPMVFYRDGDLSHVDAIVPRIGASVTFYGTAVVRQFEMMGTFALNDSVAINRSRDKLRSLQLLSKKGLGLPTTGFAHSTKMSDHLIRMVGGAPLIVKLLTGTQGKGVVLAENKKAAESVIGAFRDLDANFLVQQFIRESAGTDLRCIVLGDKVVATMKRIAQEGEFRANAHLGATMEKAKITPEERKLAVKAATIMGLEFAGVDLIRSKDGPLVLEVNSSPGLEGIEKVNGPQIAEKIIGYLETRAPKGNRIPRTGG